MLEYEIVTTIDELIPYKEIWADILERENNDNPFVEYEWISTWWTMLGCKENVEIYVVAHKKKAVAFFPFIHSTRLGGIHQFEFLGQGYAIYMEVIADKLWRERAIGYLLSELAGKFTRVIYMFHGLLESRETSRILEKYAVQRQLAHSIYRVVTPYIDFTSIELSDFLKKHRKKFKTINRRERRLKSFGQVTFQNGEEDLDKMFYLFERRWQKKIDSSGFNEEETRAFIESLVRQSDGAFHVEINSLQFEGQWIGFTIDYCCRGRNFCLAMGHEPDFSLFGPGRLIERENMLNAYHANYRLYDFGSGYEPYKFEWYTDLDYTRKFVMSTCGMRERILRNALSLRESILAIVKANRKIVEWKRNTLGKLRYLLTKATMQDWICTLKETVRRKLYGQIIDVYYLENHILQKEPHFHEIPIQQILKHENRSKFIFHYFKGYKLYGEEKHVSYLRHDKLMHVESIGFMEELPSNTVYIKDYTKHILPNIVKAIQLEGQAICTTIKWYEWRKRRALTKLGFQRVEHIQMYRFFKWQKTTRQNNDWAKFIQEQGRNLDQVLPLIFSPLLI